MTTDITERKKHLEQRLKNHGITDCPITYLPYLEFDSTTFTSPYEVGCRMIILYAVAYTASETGNKQKIVDWLKRETLWELVSPNEKKLFEGNITDKQKLIDFSWEGEGAYILAWALNLISETPTATKQVSKKQLDDFMAKVPSLGESLGEFLNSLAYRNSAEIYDENLFHELATTYFRNLLFNDKKDTSNINKGISFIRHRTLNWLRRFMDVADWDETDTST